MAVDTGLRNAFRWTAAILFVLFASALVIRSTIVELSGGRGGSRFWESHPDALSSSVMAEVGQSAAHGGAPGSATMAQVGLLAAEDPLSQFPW